MNEFYALFVVACAGGLCHSSAPIMDRNPTAALDKAVSIREAAASKWSNSRAEIWLVSCRSPEKKPHVIGCERSLIVGDPGVH